ncbi:hypothetical protein PMAYCL1PPCAC_07163, partial [Pristionchus mayeri]
RMASSSTPTRDKLRARRCLFGKPEPKELDEWLGENAARMATEASSKWAFDFARERPLDEPGPALRRPHLEYEAIPGDEVPRVYRTRTYRNTTPEGQPPPSPIILLRAPMKKKAEGRRVKEGEEEEIASHLPSTSHGRPVREKKKEKQTNLRQPRITNYMAPRKRPSMEKESTGKIRRFGDISSSVSSPSPAPSSPFRFADDYSIPSKKIPSKRITRAVSSKNL